MMAALETTPAITEISRPTSSLHGHIKRHFGLIVLSVDHLFVVGCVLFASNDVGLACPMTRSHLLVDTEVSLIFIPDNSHKIQHGISSKEEEQTLQHS